ncbi:MAG TPA: MqnA/MqnD/SBP family protein [Planctomycetota bacterium]|jgi:1,4-dihydroxy-6-naphthoate synthase|nr:MqnA/MqnD/SBP family protein [Planctomycetota bacterium]
MARTITLAHSPDSDDAFMFYALAHGKVDTRGLEFRHVLEDIQTLNEKAIRGVYDVTAVSFHAYWRIRDKYVLMGCGASVGDGYGPILVSRRPLSRQDLDEATVAVPGELTTAFLVLRLYAPLARWKVMPFDRIQDAVARGDIDAGLLIHEGQLSYRDQKLHRIQDLGEWWKLGTGLPLPLGGNAIRRDLDRRTALACCDVLRDSVRYALEHRKEALEYALRYARGLDAARAERFVGMYVNAFTLELGKRGEDAVAHLFRLGHEAGVIPVRVEPEFIE